jgi:plasmid segregation protein ParM
MNSEDAFPTLYLDSSYSRHLNREGLYIAAETVERNAKADATPAPAPTSRGKRSVRETGSEDKELAAAAV